MKRKNKDDRQSHAPVDLSRSFDGAKQREAQGLDQSGHRDPLPGRALDPAEAPAAVQALVQAARRGAAAHELLAELTRQARADHHLWIGGEPPTYSPLVVLGCAALLFWHVSINIAMVIGMAPVVGVTLPLISYGGSSVLTVMAALGLIYNVSARRFSY